MAMEGLNDVLMQFYTSMAKAEHQSYSIGRCLGYIEALVNIVGNMDKRFKPKHITRVGSTASGVSAIITQEMDYLFVLDIKGIVVDIPEYPGYAKYKFDNSVSKAWEDFTNDEGYLEARKVALRLNELVTVASVNLIQNAPDGMETILKSDLIIEISDGTSVATTITGRFGPDDWAFGNFKCDIVPLIDCEGLPPSNLTDWLVTSDVTSWPTLSDIEMIKSTGYGLVAKHVIENECNDNALLPIMWRYSTSRAETILLQNMSPQSVHKIILVILKAIRLYEMPEMVPTKSPLVTSYHMKTIVLHEALEHPDPEKWQPSRLGERYVSVLERLRVCIQKGKLAHFFFPGVNLFKGGEILMMKKIEKMINDPLEYIKRLTEIKKRPFPLYTDWMLPSDKT